MNLGKSKIAFPITKKETRLYSPVGNRLPVVTPPLGITHPFSNPIYIGMAGVSQNFQD